MLHSHGIDLGAPIKGFPARAQRQRVGWGEEEQGSGHSFRRQAETETSGLKVNWPEGPREGGLGHCDDDGARRTARTSVLSEGQNLGAGGIYFRRAFQSQRDPTKWHILWEQFHGHHHCGFGGELKFFPSFYLAGPKRGPLLKPHKKDLLFNIYSRSLYTAGLFHCASFEEGGNNPIQLLLQSRDLGRMTGPAPTGAGPGGDPSGLESVGRNKFALRQILPPASLEFTAQAPLPARSAGSWASPDAGKLAVSAYSRFSSSAFWAS